MILNARQGRPQVTLRHSRRTPYLRAWHHVVDVAFPSAAVWAPTVIAPGNAPAAGAILLQSSDISTASGLDPGSLARALGLATR